MEGTRTIARALWHLQIEALAGLVFLAHLVIDEARRLSAEQAAGCKGTGADGHRKVLAAGESVLGDDLDERGAGEVGYNEPHEQEGDSTGNQARARKSVAEISRLGPCASTSRRDGQTRHFCTIAVWVSNSSQSCSDACRLYTAQCHTGQSHHAALYRSRSFCP